MQICKTCQKSSTDFYRGHSSCKPCVRDRQLRWYANNKARNYHNSRKWKVENPKRNLELEKHARNKPVAKQRQYISNSNRRARERSAPGKFTSADIRAKMEKQNGCCPMCGADIRSKYHIDHIIALTLGGSNWPHNIQLLCPPCNIRKGCRAVW